MSGNVMNALGAVYGKDVVGEEQFEAEQVAAEKGYDLYGPDVVDEHPANKAPRRPGSPPTPESVKAPPPPPAAGPTPPTEGDMATLPTLELFLKEHPGSLDLAMAEEFARPKPRRGAIEMFLVAERNREAGTREEVIAVLEAKFAQE